MFAKYAFFAKMVALSLLPHKNIRQTLARSLHFRNVTNACISGHISIFSRVYHELISCPATFYPDALLSIDASFASLSVCVFLVLSFVSVFVFCFVIVVVFFLLSRFTCI